jgi:hypothetical protein
MGRSTSRTEGRGASDLPELRIPGEDGLVAGYIFDPVRGVTLAVIIDYGRRKVTPVEGPAPRDKWMFAGFAPD